MNPKLQSFALTGLRLALATAFLSAVAGRLGLWGKYGSGWVKFVAYAGSSKSKVGVQALSRGKDSDLSQNMRS
jgi:hypothetical protein